MDRTTGARRGGGRDPAAVRRIVVRNDLTRELNTNYDRRERTVARPGADAFREAAVGESTSWACIGLGGVGGLVRDVLSKGGSR